ncbi:MAG: signal peptide peptidase SppA [Armatimonadota bacterium]|nr:signal peptide peptidase SppA [Armatimonadota bacterium]MDR7485107.1 signal peptide peptidase SppA [Armatimonadota bacterium]MDR7533495.1 signal peptide peptidase SppA [Armatimonadota bacterium]MDR7537004.1 signal peptide peptidase SppA [Armatimonadota bacterium]
MRRTVWVAAGAALAAGALAGAAALGGVAGFLWGARAGDLARWGRPAERYLSGEGPDRIAVVRVVGPISREGRGIALLGAGASSRAIIRLLDHARRDPAVKAVIVELDTPGGSVVASDEVYQALVALRRAGRPVVALMTEVAASGGYYVAAAADHIVADPTTVTGSIGVVVALANTEALSRKIGIRTIVFKSGAFKDLGNPNRPVTPAEAAIVQRLVDEAYGRFIGVVARGRRMDPLRVRRLADGRIYTGLQAHRLGLVDSLGHLPEAVAVAMRRAGLHRATVVEYGSAGVLDVLLGPLGRWLPFGREALEPLASDALGVPIPDAAWAAGAAPPVRAVSAQYLLVP